MVCMFVSHLPIPTIAYVSFTDKYLRTFNALV